MATPDKCSNLRQRDPDPADSVIEGGDNAEFNPESVREKVSAMRSLFDKLDAAVSTRQHVRTRADGSIELGHDLIARSAPGTERD